MADFGTAKTEAIKSLANINTNVLQKADRTLFSSVWFGGGTFSNLKNGDITGNDAQKFISELFKQVAVLFKTSPTSANVLLTTSRTAYTSISSANDPRLYDSATPRRIKNDVIDVNFITWLGTDAQNLAFQKILVQLYLLHDLFSTQNWGKFKSTWPSGSTVYLQCCKMPVGGVTTLVKNVKLIDDGITLQSDEYNILDPSTYAGKTKATVKLRDLSAIGGETIPLREIRQKSSLNVFPIRRIFYLWIRMAQYRITTVLPEHAFKEAAFKLLEKYNKQVEMKSSFISDADTGLFAGISEKQNVFRETSGLVTDLSASMVENQKDANQINTNIEREQALEKKIRIFEYITLALLVAVFLATAVLTSTPSIEADQKVKISLGILGVSIFSVLVLILFYQSKLVTEGFSATLLKQTAGTFETDTTNSNFMANVNDFLQNTITLMSYLESYDMITNMNRSMQKDYTRYRGVNNELIVAGRRLDGIAKYSSLSRAERNSRFYLFIALTLILAVILPIYLWAVDYPAVRSASMGIAGVLAVFAIFLHTYETTSIVRTDGKKKYWGQPKDYA
jgi:hypothetical protein